MDSTVVCVELGSRWLRAGVQGSVLSSGGRAQALRCPPALRQALAGCVPTVGASAARLAEELGLALTWLLTRALLLHPRACSVLVCEPLHCPDALRGALERALLVDAGVQSVAFARAPLCAALGCAAWSALVVDIGEHCTRCALLVQGALLAPSARECAGGGAALRALGVALLLGAAAAAPAAGAAAAPAPAPRQARKDPLAVAVSPFPALPPSSARAASLCTPFRLPCGAASAPWVPGQRDFELVRALLGAEAGLLLPALLGDAAGRVASDAAAAEAQAEAAPATGSALWAALDAWCDAPPRCSGDSAMPLPTPLARALGCVNPLPLPPEPWLAVCTGEALLCPALLERTHSAALAALAPILAPAPLPSSAPLLHHAALIAAGALASALAPALAAPSTLGDTVARCLLSAPLDARKPLAQCIVVCGGVSAAPGFSQALLAAVGAAVQGRRQGGLGPLLCLLPLLRTAPCCLGGYENTALVGTAMLAQALTIKAGAWASVSVCRGSTGSTGSSGKGGAVVAPPPDAKASALPPPQLASQTLQTHPAPAAARLALLSKGLQGGRGALPSKP